MDIHLRQFDGITFGMDADSAALRKLKKLAYYGEVKPHGYHCTVKRMCLPAESVAAVMRENAWQIRDRYMETITWDNEPEYYIVYGNE